MAWCSSQRPWYPESPGVAGRPATSGFPPPLQLGFPAALVYCSRIAAGLHCHTEHHNHLEEIRRLQGHYERLYRNPQAVRDWRDPEMLKGFAQHLRAARAAEDYAGNPAPNPDPNQNDNRNDSDESDSDNRHPDPNTAHAA